jgi:Family of unknown function (DUF5519)
MDGAAERIRAEVGSWPGVVAGVHERGGGIEFLLGRRELGHLHGDRLADLPFPRRVRDELVAQGRARPHRPLPDSGWVSHPIAAESDVAAVIELFRLAYDRAAGAAARRAS